MRAQEVSLSQLTERLDEATMPTSYDIKCEVLQCLETQEFEKLQHRAKFKI